MEIDKDKQTLAKFEIARRLDRAEKERVRKRLLAALEQLREHDFAVLFHDEIIEKLSQYLCELDFGKDQESVLAILDDLGVACCSSEAGVRERALMILCVFSEHALKNNSHILVHKIADIFIQWLEYETEYIPGFAGICQQIQKISLKFLGSDFLREAEELLDLLHEIQSGALEKSNIIKGMIAKTQDGIAKKDILADLTEIYLNVADDHNRVAGVLLKSLGKRAVIFLLNKLMHSDVKEQRFLLMRLIPEAGKSAVSVFEECLEKNPPWYVIRNIICMIAENGDPALFNLVKPYLRYSDIRVQQQAIVCIRMLGGEEMKQRLVAALPEVHDELKIWLVMELGRYSGSDVASVLLDLFERRGLFSAPVAEELLIKLCIALKAFPCQRTVKDLKQLIEERRQIPLATDKIRTLAEEVLAVVTPKVRHESKGEMDALNALSFDSDPILEHTAKRRQSDFIEEIHNIVGKGNIGKATEMVYAEAVRVIGERDFKSAELFRDKLLEINPMALSQALKISELLEKEKGSTITGHHIEIWSALYEKMTTEEFNALHFAMKRETYGPEEIIVRSGEMDPCLFFVNSGLVHLSCLCGHKETFLKRLQPGEVIGVGQFFSVSVWTVSLVSQSVANVHVLERDRFLALKKSFPHLEKKLHEFCLKYDLIPWLLQMTGSDRREFARYPLSVLIDSVLLDPYGVQEQHAVKGEMIDISRGGFSFSIGMLNEERAKVLLGRQIISEIHLGAGNVLKCFGKIVGVRFPRDATKNCSVHVKVYSLIEQNDIMRCMASSL
ncbi:MAG: cyclic nucleotide-binding domain-containing protein [Desulfocapsaceae bacterium]|nr:cyclic nucleotide-binding domain-containing protein [Desulfocapsaceae bacterium]